MKHLKFAATCYILQVELAQVHSSVLACAFHTMLTSISKFVFTMSRSKQHNVLVALLITSSYVNETLTQYAFLFHVLCLQTGMKLACLLANSLALDNACRLHSLCTIMHICISVQDDPPFRLYGGFLRPLHTSPA